MIEGRRDNDDYGDDDREGEGEGASSPRDTGGEDSWRRSSNRAVVVNVDVAIKGGGEEGAERRVEKK